MSNVVCTPPVRTSSSVRSRYCLHCILEEFDTAERIQSRVIPGYQEAASFGIRLCSAKHHVGVAGRRLPALHCAAPNSRTVDERVPIMLNKSTISTMHCIGTLTPHCSVKIDCEYQLRKAAKSIPFSKTRPEHIRPQHVPNSIHHIHSQHPSRTPVMNDHIARLFPVGPQPG